ncbi:MAG: glutamate synthase subunit beta [Firmicutes bacterium]|nr:glutamate synthase subunit beta [Bacillota bacterium]
MGKPTGFLEYERVSPPARPALARLGDWEEFHGELPEEELRRQAARCIDCGTPFCHAGMDLGGGMAGCPLGNLIPEWNDLDYRGAWRAAAERLLATNDFPEFTGRVCPALCEGSCAVGKYGRPVTVRALELAIVERAFAEEWILPRPPRVRTGKKVAVVGAGPAGLACAVRLNRAGHAVTVFERADRPGGLLLYGIPPMKLGKEIIRRRVDLLVAEGIRFVTGVEVGRDLPVETLRAEFDAVVLCAGAGKPRDLAVPGRNLAGIHLALEFLSANTRRLLSPGSDESFSLSAAGKDVVVVGGGDTGTDCVATALRQGCRSVRQLEILPRPPVERSVENPWPQYPRVFKVDYGQEEAIAVFGRDPREYGVLVEEFVGDGAGRLIGVRVARVSWEKRGGRAIPVEIAGSGEVLPAQLGLIAPGFLGPEDLLPDRLGLPRRPDGLLEGLKGYATSHEGVFIAGDMRRGQSLVVWAIREGREAAREVDRYLLGEEGLTWMGFTSPAFLP